MDGVRFYISLSNSILLLLIFVDQRAAQRGVQDYCNWESFNATCGHNEVIVMETARYGRMRAGRCASKEYGHVGCSQEVVEYTDSLCSGRRRCEVPVTGFVKDGIRPCPKDVTSYLEASYFCVEAATQDYTECITNRKMKLTASSGFISPSRSGGSLSLTASCPWVIEVQPGQKINLTLLDFGVYKQKKETIGPQTVYCNRYARIKEPDLTQNTPICAGSRRENNVYISKGNRLEVNILQNVDTNDKSHNQAHFLIKYEAIGCPALKAPVHGRLRIVGDTATVSCNNTKETWFLRCRGNSWVGHAGNCSSGGSTGVWSSIFGREWSSSHGILIVIGLGVGLGIIIGVFLLLVALVCLKRRGWSFGCDPEPETDKPSDMRIREQSQYGTAPKGAYMRSADSLLQDHMLDPRLGSYDPRATWASGGGQNFGTMPGSDNKIRGMVSRLSESSLGHIYESPDFASRELYNTVGRDPS